MALRDKEKAFVDAFVGEARFVATTAAIMAGYSERSAANQAYRLMRKDEVRKAIDARLAEQAASSDLARARLIAELEAIAFANLGDVATWNEGGDLIVMSSSDLPPAALASLKEVRSTTSTRSTVYKAIKQHDKVRAMALLAKIQGLVTEKVEHSGTVGLTLTQLSKLAGAGEEGDTSTT